MDGVPPEPHCGCIRTGLGKRLFAAFQKWGSAKYAPLVHERKRRLLESVSGTVLEIGAGTGTNFEYFPKDVRWIGVEPNAHMQRHLRTRAASLGMEQLDLRSGVAERLPADDASVDTVVSTLVLCSVRDQDRALAEIRRVLKPGGELLFMEHVRADDPKRARWQDRLERPWRVVAMGCHPNRSTLERIQAAGFDVQDLRRGELPKSPPIVRPLIAGRAIAP